MLNIISSLFGKLNEAFPVFRFFEDGPMQPSITEQRAFSLEIEYQPIDRCIRITTHGTYTKEADEQLVNAGINAVQQHQTNLVLIDERDMELELKYWELFDLPVDHEKMHVPHNVRVAILFKPTKKNLSQYRLYENRSVICGFKHHVFTDERSARAWLSEGR